MQVVHLLYIFIFR